MDGAASFIPSLNTAASFVAATLFSFFGYLLVSADFRARFFAFVWIQQGETSIDKALHLKKIAYIKSSDLSGRVLDVGSGGGIQLKYIASCPRVTEIVCVEPNPNFSSTLRRRIDEAVKLRVGTPLKVSVFKGTVEEYIQSNNGGRQNFDAVTCFLVLCSIPNPLSAVKLLHDKCLKPGGRLYFIEHVCPDGRALRTFFKCAQPAWNLLGDGCQLCRHTQRIIQDAAHWETIESDMYFAPKLRIKIPWVFGYATKAQSSGK